MMPTDFWNWAYTQRAMFLESIIDGHYPNESDLYIQFTRHTPVMITDGPAGLNGSVKGCGFVPVLEKLEYIVSRFKEHIAKSGDKKAGMLLLKEFIYSAEASKNIDRTKLVTLELAYNHTYTNVKEKNFSCTLLYYQPPSTSYEVRGIVSIVDEGLYREYANSIHDLYHTRPEGSKQHLTYLFNVLEVFDNSVGKFGKKLND